MKQRKRILLLSSVLLVTIGLLLTVFQPRKAEDPKVYETEVKGSENLHCEGTFIKVQESLDLFDIEREWYLIGNSTYNTVDILLENEEIESDQLENIEVSYEIGGDTGAVEYDESKNSWVKTLSVDDIDPGEYDISLKVELSDCELDISKTEQIKVSHPVYVAWTMDWEGFDVEEKYLDSITTISRKYNIPITHFFNPYIYISLSENRSEYLTNWVLRRQNIGDSIGLHLHMNNKMVEAAGVTPKTDISWGGWARDGQDVPNSAYGYNDYKKIVVWAQNQFEKNALPKPTMFRAGAWFIDEENLEVLDDLGFKIESSGRTYQVYGENKLESPWRLQSVTQPYMLNKYDQNIVNNPNMNLWEFPNNGADTWAYTSDDLIERFNDNYKGGISESRKVVTYLSHPHWFNVDEPKVYDLLDYTENFGIVDDRGPVVYTTLDRIEIN